MFGGEEPLGAIPGDIFDDVGELTSAIVALAWVALGIFVGEDSSGSLENRAADKVLGGDHFESFVLALNLVLYLLGYLGIGAGEGGD
jgi:hypothetical protein